MNYTLSSSSQRLQKNFVCRRSFLEIRKQKLIAFKVGVGFLKSSLVATAKKPVWLLLRSHRGKSLRPRQKPLPPKPYYDICSSPKQIKNGATLPLELYFRKLLLAARENAVVLTFRFWWSDIWVLQFYKSFLKELIEVIMYLYTTYTFLFWELAYVWVHDCMRLKSYPRSYRV